jgi:16S rRNA (uracil1498-N3)-methyltransferase
LKPVPPRLFVRTDATSDDRAHLDAAGARHLRALRLAPGDSVHAIVGPGLERSAMIETFTRTAVVLRLGDALPPSGCDPVGRRTLAVGLGDLARMDLVVEKATELGATAIQPFIASRSQIRAVPAARAERWARIARAACEQCGRTVPPEIRDCVTLASFIDTIDAADTVLLFVRGESSGSAGPPAAASPGDDRSLILVVGPEGGFAPDEVSALLARGAVTTSLGRRILRFETAAIAALVAAAARFPEVRLGSRPLALS